MAFVKLTGKVRTKKCKYCKEPFEINPIYPLQYVCSWGCGLALNKINATKKEAKDWKEKKAVMVEKLMTHKDYLKLLQVVFNTFIRMRDKDLPCITCGTSKNIEYAAGHFYPTTYQYLRFNEDNVHLQCNKSCNMMKRGNLLEYRPALIKKIGIERVEILDNTRHLELQISIPELKEKIKEYKLKIKNL